MNLSRRILLCPKIHKKHRSWIARRVQVQGRILSSLESAQCDKKRVGPPDSLRLFFFGIFKQLNRAINKGWVETLPKLSISLWNLSSSSGQAALNTKNNIFITTFLCLWFWQTYCTTAYRGKTFVSNEHMNNKCHFLGVICCCHTAVIQKKIGWQKLRETAKDLRRQAWTQTKILRPNILISWACRGSRTFWNTLDKQCVFFSLKKNSVSWARSALSHMVHIAYHTELNLQFVKKIANVRLTKILWPFLRSPKGCQRTRSLGAE